MQSSDRETDADAALASPCISVCVVDPCGSGVCVGCGRTLDEIAAWIDLSNGERRAVLERLPQRLAKLRARNANERR
jgi:predicted Fe-S protein YdhL (DUF1289 family)